MLHRASFAQTGSFRSSRASRSVSRALLATRRLTTPTASSVVQATTREQNLTSAHDVRWGHMLWYRRHPDAFCVRLAMHRVLLGRQAAPSAKRESKARKAASRARTVVWGPTSRGQLAPAALRDIISLLPMPLTLAFRARKGDMGPRRPRQSARTVPRANTTRPRSRRVALPVVRAAIVERRQTGVIFVTWVPSLLQARASAQAAKLGSIRATQQKHVSHAAPASTVGLKQPRVGRATPDLS